VPIRTRQPAPSPLRPRAAAAVLVAVLALVLVPAAVRCQPARAEPALFPLSDYQDGTEYLPTTPAAGGGAVGALANPAAWATGDRIEYAFWWDDQDLSASPLENWGFSLGRNLGLAVDSRTFLVGGEAGRVTDFQLGLARGDRAGALGLAYRWTNGDTDLVPRENALVGGLVRRPARWCSWGLSGTMSVESSARQGVTDLGIRPLLDDRLTLFADFALREGEQIDEGRWGAGVEIRPVDGLHLGVKWRDTGLDDVRTTFHVGVNLAGLGYHALSSYDSEGEHARTTHLLHGCASYPALPLRTVGFVLPVRRTQLYVPVDLENKRLTYQKYRMFDDRRVAWLDLARFLQALKRDPEVRGVALNLAGLTTRPSIAWELRQLLGELQAAGKEILIHVDRAGMMLYGLASVADRLTIDPQGSLILPGTALKRTYLKGTLEKLGVGFQEFRHFTHKSAMESFSRDAMSDADREQRQRVVDVYYETVRTAVVRSRGLSDHIFDMVVDEEVFVLARQAVELDLVDAVARWRDLRRWLAEERGGMLSAPSDRHLRDYREEVWGPRPRIAVVYAVGGCAMDSGIRGRATSAHLRRLAEDPGVAAVVLRADSPGGDPLPSDLVAEACRILREAGKPVVVSQGDVAASGGYWISMDGDHILTTPVTITGSIGVIAGWFWDDGLGEKAGLTVDGVQRGRRADLFTGMSLPFLGGAIPTRPLDETELRRVKERMLVMYDDFVGRVAAGRGLDEARVREIAEGRVWMGGDALELGLVDGFGGLLDAIDLARQRAGIPRDRDVDLVEYPPRPLLEWPFAKLAPRLISLGGLRSLLGAGSSSADLPPDPGAEPEGYDWRYLRALAADPGRPQLLVPPDLLPAGWAPED
jgi:protease-4